MDSTFEGREKQRIKRLSYERSYEILPLYPNKKKGRKFGYDSRATAPPEETDLFFQLVS